MHSFESQTSTPNADACPVHEIHSSSNSRYKTPRQHVRRAARTLRLSVERSATELSDGLKRAATELRNAAKSAREVWRENR